MKKVIKKSSTFYVAFLLMILSACSSSGNSDKSNSSKIETTGYYLGHYGLSGWKHNTELNNNSRQFPVFINNKN
jgi:hypothetical protein